ncbi:hypothetical protein ACFQLX_19085 [Streptomyces polyrhachis]|uniref:Uncharacterized protein n=1 Tax=Streptomyces polyrhachis TaxID=1282885 RepID=A0ABW2GM83_9ACTN
MNEEHSVTRGEAAPRPHPRAARGCTAVFLFACAVLAVLLSFMATSEMESSPGLRENMAPLAVCTLAFGALSAVGGLALTGRRSYGGSAAAICLGLLIALRMWTLAPALHCWSYDSVGRDADGSYRCVNREHTAP